MNIDVSVLEDIYFLLFIQRIVLKLCFFCFYLGTLKNKAAAISYF